MKLYVYDHCPYCVKARAIFGLTGRPVELVTPLNDDEATPMRLIGKKMVPILQKDDGSAMGESMDIVAYIERLGARPVLEGAGGNATLQAWLTQMDAVTNPLVMPRWIAAAEAGDTGPFLHEFSTELARRYFVKKKEAYIGPFDTHRAQSADLMARANLALEKLAPLIRRESSVHEELSEDDIHLFARLRSLSIVKGLVYPSAVEAYRQTLSRAAQVPLHDAIAR